MSSTFEAINARAYLQNWLRGLVSMYTADINATPDEKWNETFGGCTKSACQFTADAIGMLMWATTALKGTPANDGYMGQMEIVAGQCGTKAGAIEKLSTAADEFIDALGKVSEEDLAKDVVTPWGMPTPLFMVAQIAVSHVWYHDGQLNYVQCLLGDDKVHWMGG